MARRSVLRDAGFISVPGSARRLRDPEGREVSYREAYKRATGLTMEEAVNRRYRERTGKDISDPDARKHGVSGKFQSEFHDARQIRAAARAHVLSRDALASEDDERAIATARLRDLTAGHMRREGTSLGMLRYWRGPERAPGPERETPFGRLLGLLATRTSRPRFDDYPSGREGRALYDADLAAFLAENGPTSKKALLLVAMGRRDADAEYAVGETPR